MNNKEITLKAMIKGFLTDFIPLQQQHLLCLVETSRNKYKFNNIYFGCWGYIREYFKDEQEIINLASKEYSQFINKDMTEPELDTNTNIKVARGKKLHNLIKKTTSLVGFLYLSSSLKKVNYCCWPEK